MLKTLLSVLVLVTATPPPGPLPTLPEIGRTKAVSPACAVMRDLAIPSFQAARNSDDRMVKVAPALVDFAELKAQSTNSRRHFGAGGDWSGPDRNRLLAKVGSAVATMMQNDVAISKALGDPRLSPTSTDPSVVAQRAALEALYAAQSQRAAIIWQLQFRQNSAQNLEEANDLADASKGKSNSAPDPAASPTGPGGVGVPDSPQAAERFGLPRFTGNSVQDGNTMQVWNSDVAAAITANERRVAATLYPIATRCATDAAP